MAGVGARVSMAIIGTRPCAASVATEDTDALDQLTDIAWPLEAGLVLLLSVLESLVVDLLSHPMPE